MSIFSQLPLVWIALSASSLVYAQTDALTPNSKDPCLPEWIASPQTLPPPGSLTQVEGDQLVQTQANQITLTGHVRLSEPGLVVLSDQLFYDRDSQHIRAFGQVEFHQKNTILLGEQAEFNQTSQIGHINQVQYQLSESRAHGLAQRLDFNQAERISHLNQASFSTCPLTDPAWNLHFGELEINDPKRRLYGYSTWLEFKGVPIFYTPYIDIPLDDRASGFLFPYIGSHKTAAQTQADPLSVVAVPYYFNIAPNIDDTLTLIGIQDRGLVLDNEFRYLQPKHSGELQFSLLQDQLANSEGLRHVDRSGAIINEQALSERWRISYAGRQNWGAGFSSSLNWQEVSDPDFYNDIPLSFAASETRARSQTTTLNRSARLNFSRGPVQAHIQHYGYLPLRNGERNYLEKSPEVGVNLGQSFGAFRTNLYLETTEFKRYSGFNDFFDDGYVAGQTSTGVMGRRSLALPSIQYQLNRPYARLQAQVQANYRQYDLINAAESASTDNTVMQYALRGGLFFERDVSLFNTNYIQTLEPEVQLLYVPYVDQSHLQLFDTGRTSLDFSNLFQLNRFSGFDRIGDTQQISTALTTRLLDNSGMPLADAAIGQIFYLADREVELGGNQLQDDPRSDYFVRVSTQLKSFNFASTSQYDYETTELTQMQNRLKWQAFNRVELLTVHQALNLDADPALDNTENINRRQQTIGAGLILDLSTKWQIASYVNYDMQEQAHREFLGGLRYDSCCWASELVITERQLADGRYNASVNFVFELKGLSTVGSRMRDNIQSTLNF